MLIGYARTSTVDQVAGLEAQEAALAATGRTKLFAEQASSVGQRDQLAAVLKWVREGDALVVTRARQAGALDGGPAGDRGDAGGQAGWLAHPGLRRERVDTRSPTGRMLLTMFAAVAEFERSIMLERQRAGVARAMALKAQGLGASAIAAELGISRASVYRVLAEAA